MGGIVGAKSGNGSKYLLALASGNGSKYLLALASGLVSFFEMG
jgi:hypothetical protein